MGALLSMLLAGLKAILQLLAFLVRIVYNILKLFKVRLLALYLLVCLFVQIFYHIFDGPFGKAYFYAGLAACILVTLYGWAKPIREAHKRRKLKERDRRLEEEREEKEEEREAQKTQPSPAPAPVPVRAAPQYPQYFDVTGHPDFMFAEYADRYELFRKGTSGLEYIRTDYKADGGYRG